MKFVCKKCGMCCRNLHLNDLYKDLHEGDGICKYLDQETNLCTIYENRPLLCNVDKAYEIYFKDLYSKKEYYELNKRSCDYLGGKKEIRDETEKKKATKENATALATGLKDVVQKYGEGNSQFFQAYKGERYDSAGNKIEYKGRSLKEIQNYKVNDENAEQNLKQQSGFDAELIKEARDNQKKIINGEKTRTRTSDGQGNTNDQKYDHVEVDESGNVIEGSGSQMKFLSSGEKTVDKIVKDPKWEKYKDAPIDIPSDQYEDAKKYCDQKASDLRKQAENQRSKGNTERAEKLESQAKEYENAKNQLRNSGVSTDEALQARKNAKLFVAKETVKSAHSGGVQAAKSTALVSGAVSVAQNIYAVAFQDKDIEEAVKDVAKTTAKAAGTGYVIGAGGTVIKSVMHSSSKEMMRRLSNTNVPALIVSSTIEVGKSLKSYATGQITATELMEELGEKGTGMLASGLGSAIGAAAGTLIIPGIGTTVGGIVGGMIGYTVNKVLYDSSLQVLKECKLSEEMRAEMEMISREAIRQQTLYQEAITRKAAEEHENRQKEIESFFEKIGEGVLSDNIDLFFEATQTFGQVFNRKLQFETFDEFDEFMRDDSTELIL